MARHFIAKGYTLLKQGELWTNFHSEFVVSMPHAFAGFEGKYG